MMNPLETGHQPSPRKKSQPQKPTAKPAKSGQQQRPNRRSQTTALPAGKKTAPQALKPKSSQPISRFWKKWIADGVAFTLLFGGTTLIGGCAWFSYQLIVNPDIGVWLNQLLPSWTQIPLQRRDSIVTLEEINQALKTEGLRVGKSLTLPMVDSVSKTVNEQKSAFPLNSLFVNADGAVQQSNDLLIPIIKSRESSVTHPCEGVCEEIVQVRVYQAVKTPYQRQGSTQYYRLIQQLETKGPAESFVIASLIGTESNQQGSNKPLPLTRLTQFKGKVPQGGVWFSVHSERIIADKTVPYGQILHYNPSHNYLSMMLEWKSAAGQQPIWQEVTGGKDPELLIEQTIGLEPQFSIYQVQPLQFIPNPIQLTAISLDETFLDDYNYRQALRLARSGLWSPALDLIKPLKKNIVSGNSPNLKWSMAVQAQLDLIEFHAKITKAQAIAAWASPSQQVLASLIDGRWNEALEFLKNSPGNQQEIGNLLRSNGGRIKNRLNAALLENPEQLELKTWGTLMIAAENGRNRAITWLDEQPQTEQKDRQEILELLLKSIE
ncbi:hypothetical protein [Planktothrix paucivesiculata]|uniref:Uncharacterized protein n=1 Tax=Planktothrix paucivesiculata PCC 9631 TaxID=671071 RepID=A0A7Z9BP73_9CYAN|nr:hypothetical protein [Planktothrix paucivesiculata]VXD17253.1 conserved hypothetical protein [Planktothrix paucivesiculata PCC 9631]